MVLLGKRCNVIPAHNKWFIFQVCLGSTGPLKDAKAFTTAFGQLLMIVHPRFPRRLNTDSDFQALMKSHGIYQFASESEQKADVMDRFNLTIKTRIWTYLSIWGTVRLVDLIQDLVVAWNHSRHRSIGLAPVGVHQQNPIWVHLFADGDSHLKSQIPQEAIMRTSSHKTIFGKGYMTNRTKEKFPVSQAVPPRRGIKRRINKLVD